VSEPDPDLLQGLLDALRWSAEDLDPDYPVRLANAGSEHLVLVTKTRTRLADLDYDFDALANLMRDHGLITVQLVWPESKKRYHSRNPFASSGVVEDPATGASAAAFGAYLRELGFIAENASFTIIQGVDMGLPSEINVNVIGGEPGIRVSGTAHRIESSPDVR
jgi:PhzF family phenazine biosynthesis protein